MPWEQGKGQGYQILQSSEKAKMMKSQNYTQKSIKVELKYLPVTSRSIYHFSASPTQLAFPPSLELIWFSQAANVQLGNKQLPDVLGATLHQKMHNFKVSEQEDLHPLRGRHRFLTPVSYLLQGMCSWNGMAGEKLFILPLLFFFSLLFNISQLKTGIEISCKNPQFRQKSSFCHRLQRKRLHC